VPLLLPVHCLICVYIILKKIPHCFIYRNTFELPTVNVDLKITNVYPLQGSVLGGTKLTITGSGFGTDFNAVVVKFQNWHGFVKNVSCEILSLTNTQILCQIEDLRKIHQVTNMGVDPGEKIILLNITYI
jgi:hypothetical protein